MADVRFIRKNGRVIPIRKKDDYAKEKKIAATGIGINAAGGVATGIGLASEKPVDMADFKKKYAKDIKESGVKFKKWKRMGAQFASFDVDEKLLNKRINIIGGGIQRRYNSGKKTYAEVQKMGFNLGRNAAKKSVREVKTISYGALFDKESILLHELGHAKAYARKGSINNRTMTMGYGILKRNPFTRLASEAEASYEAVKMAHKAGGKKHAISVGKRMIGPYATYVGAALMTGATLAAGVKWARKKYGRK